ncbi:MAG: cation acetate symporter [Actinobacteria bacterium HGW-Actinobacteria-2]|nr:MAG: cation acetate symporter [Actinobacteria bacterium HGW-Actinobacteria-2]
MTGNPLINISIFAAFVVITLLVVIKVSRDSEKKAAAFYTGGASFSGRQNGLAITGDYLSAAAFLGVTGAIAVYGYDGLLYSVGFFVALLLALYLVAEPLRNTGQYTMADVLSFRMNQRPVRTAAALSTLTISFVYLLAQMAGAGGLVALLLGVSDPLAQSGVIAIVGVLMIVYVLIGGMKGTTWVQMIKATLLIGGSAVMSVMVLAKFGFSLTDLLHAAVVKNPVDAKGKPLGQALLEPMLKYGKDPLSFISLSLALVLGTAGLPHVLMRFYTVPSAKEARRSAVWTIALVGFFFLLTLVLGFGAAAQVGIGTILNAPGKENAAAPLLAFNLGGEVLMGIISGVAFATILAVVAGLTITASASFAHDFYNSVLKKGKADPAQEVKVARITAVAIGILAIVGGIAVNGQNIAFLISLAFAVAASANLPSILMTLYWKKFNTRGSVASIYTGLASSVLLIVFSPAVMLPIKDATGAMVTHPLALFPLTNPTLVALPLAVIAGVIGTLTAKEPADTDLQAEMEVRSMTGAGASEAVAH